MKSVLVSLAVLSLSFTLSAQTKGTTPAATSAAPANLTATLADADKAVTSTNTDLANLRVDKWSSGWKTAWMKKSSHKHQAGETADSLKQLSGALPAMIAEVRTSHGSVGSTFKLFNSMTTVCETLDSLVEATQNYGKKEEYNRLADDYTSLLRVRSVLSAYIEHRAMIVDPRGNIENNGPTVNASVKKIDVDNGAHQPKKKAVARKKPVVHQTRASN